MGFSIRGKWRKRKLLSKNLTRGILNSGMGQQEALEKTEGGNASFLEEIFPDINEWGPAVWAFFGIEVAGGVSLLYMITLFVKAGLEGLAKK